jgi:hypothetical protein
VKIISDESSSHGCLSSGQRCDPATGEVLPWYTPLALNEIQNWDLRRKTILEWGGGCSTLWWASRCCQVFTVETSAEWIAWISAQARAKSICNLTLVHRPPPISPEEYTALPTGCAPDIVVIDGAARLSCLAKSLTLPRPLTIIFDNWQQQNAFVSPKAEALMRPFVGVSYPELRPPYIKHPWQTAIWELP